MVRALLLAAFAAGPVPAAGVRPGSQMEPQMHLSSLVDIPEAPVEKASAKPRVLFGTIGCALDWFPVDVMLSHQLSQSFSRSFDTVMLYKAPCSAYEQMKRRQDDVFKDRLERLQIKKPPEEKKADAPEAAIGAASAAAGVVGAAGAREAAAVSGKAESLFETYADGSLLHRNAESIDRAEVTGLIHKVVDVQEEANSGHADRVAKFFSENDTERFLKVSPEYLDYNVAMVHFFSTCQESFDHCAWLDGDMFVHKGEVPWVDNFIQKYNEKPTLVLTNPTDHCCTSRSFMVHGKNFASRLLPLQLEPTTVGSWEEILYQNMDRNKFLQNHSDALNAAADDMKGSWVLHPPDQATEMYNILQSCQDKKAVSEAPKKTGGSFLSDEKEKNNEGEKDFHEKKDEKEDGKAEDDKSEKNNEGEKDFHEKKDEKEDGKAEDDKSEKNNEGEKDFHEKKDEKEDGKAEDDKSLLQKESMEQASAQTSEMDENDAEEDEEDETQSLAGMEVEEEEDETESPALAEAQEQELAVLPDDAGGISMEKLPKFIKMIEEWKGEPPPADKPAQPALLCPLFRDFCSKM